MEVSGTASWADVFKIKFGSRLLVSLLISGYWGFFFSFYGLWLLGVGTLGGCSFAHFLIFIFRSKDIL